MYPRSSGLVPVDSGLTLAVAPGDSISDAYISIEGYQSSEDSLGFSPAAESQLAADGIAATYYTDNPYAADMELSWSWPAIPTVADFQWALDNVGYMDSNPTPDTAVQRTIQFTIDDTNDDCVSPTAARSIQFVVQPTVNGLAAQSIAQNQPLTFSSANGNQITLSDADASGANEQLTLSPTNGAVALGSTTGVTVSGSGTASSPLVAVGTLASLNTALAGMVFTSTADFNDGAGSLTVGITDQGDDETASGTITINVAADQPPVLTSTTTTASFTAGGSPVTIDPGITVSDADNTTLQSATVTIGGYVAGEDQLVSTLPSDINVSNIGGVYTFTGTDASPGDFQTALRTIAYKDVSSTPTTTPRTLSIVVSDGQLNSNTVTYTIDVSAASGGSGAPTAPTIFVPGGQSVSAGGSLAFSWGDENAISVADPEIGTGTDAMTLKVSDGVLNLGSTGSLASVAGNGTGSVSITGTLAAIDTALDGLVYTPNTGFASDDSLAMILTDSAEPGGPQTANESVAIGVTAAPTADDLMLTPSIGSLYYNAAPGEAQTAVPVDSGLALSDNNPIASATLSFASGYVSGEDLLVLGDDLGGTISSSWNAGTLTLTGPAGATAADYQAALRSITYEDSNANPTVGSRSLSLTVTDGALNTMSAAYTINVIGTNSSLAVNAPSSQGLEQGGSAMFAWSSGNPISVADPNTNAGNDSMTLSVNSGSLYLSTSAGLASSSGDGTASISVSGTLAAIDAALDGLEYFPGADYAGSDLLAMTLADGVNGQSTSANVSLSISPTAPAPSFTPGPDEIVPVGASTQTIPGWATGITADLPNGSGATFSFIVAADNPSLFTTQPEIDEDGDLTYTPAPGANGTANIAVELEATPTGGTPVDSAASVFTITVGTGVQPQLVTPKSELFPADSELEFGSASAGGIYIAGDTDTTALVTVTIATDTGYINIDNDTPCTISNQDSSLVTLTGTIADVNGDLAYANLNPTDPSVSNAGSGTVTVSLSWTSGGISVASAPVLIPLTIIDPTAAAATEISISLPTNQRVPENQPLTFSSATGNPITINADPAAEAEVAISAEFSQISAESMNRLTLSATNGLTMVAGSGDGDTSETFIGTVADINAALDGLEFSSPYGGQQSLTVIATLLGGSDDALGVPATASTSITMHSAPSFNSYLGLWLNDQPQDSGDLYSDDSSVYGTTAGEILWSPQNSLMDPTNYSQYNIGSMDAGGMGAIAPVTGIAITSLDTQDGTWQVSSDAGGYSDDGNDWQDIQTVSDSHALLLDSSDSIRFIPNPNADYFGDITDAVTFRLWDESSGTAMKYADVSDNGGTTAFSADTATAALRIDPLVSLTGGGGGTYTISTTSAVPWDLDVAGTAEWNGSSPMPFTATIPAGDSSTSLDLSTLAGLDIDWLGDATFTVQLSSLGADYDYVVDPSAASVTTTTAGSSNNQPGPFHPSNVWNGDTIPIGLDNSSSTTAMTWWTVDGTAKAGQDYDANHGTIPPGGWETITITLDNVDALGDSAFYVVTSCSGSGVDNYSAITIQTAGLQLLADSDNDGRIDAEGDATAADDDVEGDSGGVLITSDGGNPSGLNGQQLIASGQLVEVDLGSNSLFDGSVTLSATGNTGDFVVWNSPAMTNSIQVAGAGTTWPVGSVPAAVWIEEPIAGDDSANPPAMVLTLSDAQDPVQVRIQSARGSITAYTMSRPYLPSTPLSTATVKTQGVGILRNGDDDNGNSVPDGSESIVGSENDLVHIRITVPYVAGVDYILEESNTDVSVWQSPQMYAYTPLIGVNPSTGVVAGQVNGTGQPEFDLSSIGSRVIDLYVDWTNMDLKATASTLELVARPSTAVPGSPGRLLDSVTFHPFTSIIVGLSGETSGLSASESNPGSSGLLTVAQQLDSSGYNSWFFGESAVNPDGTGAVYNEIMNEIKYHGITQVALYGHSHGGGSAYNLGTELYTSQSENGVPAFSIAYTAYVDAISNTSFVNTWPQAAFPISKYTVNLYETLGTPAGASIPTANVDIDVNTQNGALGWLVPEGSAELNHGNIDNSFKVQQYLINGIRQHVNR